MAIGVIAILALSGGVVLAAIPDSETGVINGCYLKSAGILRVIDAEAGKECTRWETAISWNQVGPAGEPGPQGETGAQGTQGEKGEPGADGVAGLQGEPGVDGPAGPTGPIGPAGPQGERGPQGVAGPAGADGASLTESQVEAWVLNGPIGLHQDSTLGGRRVVSTADLCADGQGLSWDATANGWTCNDGAASGGGLSGWQTTYSALVTLQPGETATLEAHCPAGKVVLGGGFQGGDVVVLASGPAPDGSVWVTQLRNMSVAPLDLVAAVATCADRAP